MEKWLGGLEAALAPAPERPRPKETDVTLFAHQFGVKPLLAVSWLQLHDNDLDAAVNGYIFATQPLDTLEKEKAGTVTVSSVALVLD